MNIVDIVASLIAVILIFVPHEFAHAYVADKCGDATARMNGRLTLNPIKHIDPFGFILCVFAGFGWAKPVPVNPANFRRYRSGMFFTAIAGVTVNLIFAFFAYPIYLCILNYAYYANHSYFLQHAFVGALVEILYRTFFYVYAYGLCIAFFNLLPLFPLDGFRVVESLTRQVNPVRRFLRNYGYYILIILVLESFLCTVISEHTNLWYADYFDILGYLQYFAVEIVGYPMRALWNLIIKPEVWLNLYYIF